LLSLEISYGISPWKISFPWSCLLLISGCFLSVTILYHSPWNSSIRRYANDAAKDLCSFNLAAPGRKWYNKYVGLLYSPDRALSLLARDGAFLAGLCCDPAGNLMACVQLLWYTGKNTTGTERKSPYAANQDHLF
jgi:hypothetical protein